MLTIVRALIDHIFPPRTTERLIRALIYNDLKGIQKTGTYRSIHYLLPYQNETVRALIKENKYHGNQRAATLLAECLLDWLNANVSGSTILIPIPLSTTRKKARGYNQIEHILRHLSPSETVTYTTHLLIRTKDTVPQTTLKRQARLANTKGIFTAATTQPLPQGGTVIIIDDVVTTGATLMAARAALAPYLHPSSTLLCLALAH